MRHVSLTLAFLSAQLVAAGTAHGQALCDSTGEVRELQLIGTASEYARLSELVDSNAITPRLARRLSNSMIVACARGPWTQSGGYTLRLHSEINAVRPSWLTTVNSAYPEDRNNGALWSGRGISSALEGGVILKAGRLSVGVLPVVAYQQNRAYETLPRWVATESEFSSGLYAGLDEPQRFGPDAYATADWGQSYVRADIGRVGLGISNENLWWGPGLSNAILFTNTAPGFPHVFLNTRRALNVGIGRLTGEAIWGRLSESAYFDTIPANDHRLIVGGLIAFEPGWVRGLFIGIGRTFVMPWDSVDARNLFPLGQQFWKKDVVMPNNPNGSNDDQRVSLMARYVLPTAGFELYGEWAREDHSWDASDFIQEPEHSSGHVIGFQKLFTPQLQRWVRVYGEVTNLQQLRQNRPSIRTTPRFYVHPPQGHTQLGQLLGAAIGPGGESQLFGIDVTTTKGLLGGYVERVRRDEFSTIGIAAWSTTWPPRHDVAVTAGVRFTREVGPLRLDADLGRSKRYNRNFIRTESNTRLQLRVSWLPTF